MSSYFLDELANGEVMCTVIKNEHLNGGNSSGLISRMHRGDGGGWTSCGRNAEQGESSHGRFPNAAATLSEEVIWNPI
jgi:hypothetical protein